MTERDQDLRHGPEVQPGSVPIPTERGSDRFIGQISAIMGSLVPVLMGGPAGDRIGRGVAEIVVQGSSEWAIRAGGNIGSGAGILIGLTVSGIVLYRVFRR